MRLAFEAKGLGSSPMGANDVSQKINSQKGLTLKMNQLWTIK